MRARSCGFFILQFFQLGVERLERLYPHLALAVFVRQCWATEYQAQLLLFHKLEVYDLH